MLDRSTAPTFKTISQVNIPQASTHYLKNGIPVHVINAGHLDVVRLEFIIKAGSWYEEKKGYSYFCTQMLREGTANRSAKDISDHIDKYGAFLDLSAELDFVTISLYTLNKHLSSLTPLLKDLLYHSIFPEEELDTLKNIKAQQIRVNNEKNNVVASKKFREMLFGKAHPYGKNIEVDDIPEISRKELVEFHAGQMAGNYEIIISGHIEEGLLDLLDKYFGGEKVQRLAEQENIASNSSGEKQLVKDKPASVQSSIRMGKLLFQKNHPDYIKMRIVNEILGGYFGSRLMKNIREEKGYTYGIFSRIVNLKHAGYFIIGADVKKEFAPATVTEIYNELKKLREELIDDDELQTVKNYMTGSFLSGINTPFDLADKFKSIYLLDLGYDYYQDYIATINNISAETVMDMASRYLKDDSFTEVIVG